jgi:DNA-binding MarR family transcriptional regulator
MPIHHSSDAGQIIETIILAGRGIAARLRATHPGLDPSHVRMLALLRAGGLSLSELAAKQGVSLPGMSNSISALVRRGWVTRVRPPMPQDRRVVLVELTPAGRAALAETQRDMEVAMEELLASLSPSKRQGLTAGLEVLRDALARSGVDAWNRESQDIQDRRDEADD